MQRTGIFFLVSFALLGLIGLADTLYLAFAYYTDTALVCDILDGCNVVAQSSYSNLFGIPLAYWGVLYFAGVAAIAGGMWLRLTLVDRARWLVLLYVTLGALMSVYFVYVQVALIEAICIYCLVSAVLTWLLFIVALLWFRRVGTSGETPEGNVEREYREYVGTQTNEKEHEDGHEKDHRGGIDKRIDLPQNVR